MRRITSIAVIGIGLAVSACSGDQVTKSTLNAAPVDRILVVKERRKLYLMSGNEVLRVYDVGLGFDPEGDKVRAGDGRTPEGRYRISQRNRYSNFYLSLGISYPDQRDVAEARAKNVDPGGDIFIHGQPNNGNRKDVKDWTAGCIAVSDQAMYEIYTTVRDGTIIDIIP